ncbi:cold-shock protein [Roseateles sp. LKC17W]|uniref:Cold-shock protein n=1 Tax=Pelomonas margarita TaxID=3299031 RepID=A0ABW7FLF4_9BURK
MRFQGLLSEWNPDVGCGRIRPLGGGEEVFVALAAFPTEGEGPRLDEPLSFEVVTGQDGRKRAVRLARLATLHPALREATGAGQVRVRRAQKKRRLGLVAGAVIAGLLVVGAVSLWPAQKPADVSAALRR